MELKKIKSGLERIVEDSIERLGSNLQAIFMFGSGNHEEDFIPNLSDLDFIYILENLDFEVLKSISLVRQEANQNLEIKVDIKPFTKAEFLHGIEGKSSFEFFTGWGLKMIELGQQKCLYQSENLDYELSIDSERLRKDALERAHYYMTKLRKIYSSNDAFLLRGENKSLDNLDYLKLVSSSIKNVLTFCLAYNGVIVNRYDEVLEQSRIHFGEVSTFERLFKAKKSLTFNSELLIEGYDKIEKIYLGVING